MRSTIIGLAAAAAIITAGSALSASACPYHQGYGGLRGEYRSGGYRPEFGREYRREFERREHPRREFGGGEYPRHEYRRGEYGERGGYGEYRD
jgi:hypothetical protein